MKQVIDRMRGSRRALAACLLWNTSKPLSLALLVDVVAGVAFPVLVAVSLGALVGALPAAVVEGADSPEAGALLVRAMWVGAAFLASMLTTVYHKWLDTTLKARLVPALRVRLMRSVCDPVGIAHLEDASVRDRLALALGNLMTFFPADAPAQLALVTGTRLTWLAGCVVIGVFRWWLGVALFLVWLVGRRQILAVVREHIAAFGGNAAVLRRADYFHELATHAAAAKELRTFGLGTWIVDRYRSNWLDGMGEVQRIHRGVIVMVTRVGIGVLVVYVGSCAVIADAAYDGSISLSRVALLLPMLVVTISGGAVTFDDIALEWQLSALPELDTLERDLAGRRSDLAGGMASTDRPQHEIRFDGVGFRYPGGDAEVLSGLDLEIPAGRSLAIVGANGTGKTTLVKLLSRLQDPTDGTILVDGIPLDQFDARRWQRNIAVVFQDFVQPPFTVAETIGLGAHEHRDDRAAVIRAAERAGARELVESLPRGWDTVLSAAYTDGVDLSGGEWQRIALARALFSAEHGARVLVLDEPTSMLDVRAEHEFFDRFLDITAGLTTVVISHRFSTVRRGADRIVVLDGGRIVEQGSHEELLELDGHYARMFTIQAARFREPEVAP